MKALQKVGSVRPSGLLRPYEWPAPTPAQTLKHGSLIASGRSALGQPGKVGAGHGCAFSQPHYALDRQ